MNIFEIKELQDADGRVRGLDRSFVYALAGVLLGIAAPLGWMLMRAIFFNRAESGFFSAILAHLLASRENISLFLYMGVGTSFVLGLFGYFIGRAAQQIHQRAVRLDELKDRITQQKEDYERRYHELNDRIRNFHGISARLQCSMDVEELYSLTGDNLHQALEFDRVNFFLVDTQEQLLRLVVGRGIGDAQHELINLPLDERAGVLYKAIVERRHFLIDDVRLMPEDFHLKPPCDAISHLRSRSFLVCPVVTGDKVVALICVDNKTSGRDLGGADADTLKLFADQLSSTMTRIDLVNAVVELTDELELTFKELGDYRDRYQKLLKSLKNSSDSTRTLVKDIVHSADVVRDAVNTTQSASGEISVSIEQVSNNIAQLSEFMEKSISAMSQIAAAIRSVEEHSIQSHQMSEKARQKAENGVESVQETLTGLQGIQSGVDEAASAMDKLSGRGDEVSNITTVITEIAQKTNLLALNAAIIAAQAGEQGRSFAVVAEEIRDLSQQSARSADAIAKLIRDMQNGMTEVVAHIDNTGKLVENGYNKGKGADDALGQILETAGSAMEMAQRIRQATREVSASAEFVTRSIEELGEMTDQISGASREQAQGTRSIVHSIEDVRRMTEDMARATLQQNKNSEDIENNVASVSEMASRIFITMEKRRKQSHEVISRLQQMKDSK